MKAAIFYSLFLFFILPVVIKAQPIVYPVNVLELVVIDGDTFPMFNIRTITIQDHKRYTKRQRRKYGRLKRYVVKVYPYAELAGEMLQDFDDTLRNIKSEAQRKKYIKQVERELKTEFEGELKGLTIKQGILLVKLIDRETGNTSYDLIKSLRGSFSAFIWQSLARIFGSNLKLEYDPNGEDAIVEEIVEQLESGAIPYEKRLRKLKI
ncbi:MAG: DUF4294 domain-containing protein [Flavobacteriales bacterium]|nr:DUF4294 domain-containing protein [Flavobacteriales bacterium]